MDVQLCAIVEGRVIAAWAQIPIQDGHATVTNIALRGLIGVGYQF